MTCDPLPRHGLYRFISRATVLRWRSLIRSGGPVRCSFDARGMVTRKPQRRTDCRI
jgi:hypothetical protein